MKTPVSVFTWVTLVAQVVLVHILVQTKAEETGKRCKIKTSGAAPPTQNVRQETCLLTCGVQPLLTHSHCQSTAAVSFV